MEEFESRMDVNRREWEERLVIGEEKEEAASSTVAALSKRHAPSLAKNFQTFIYHS